MARLVGFTGRIPGLRVVPRSGVETGLRSSTGGDELLDPVDDLLRLEVGRVDLDGVRGRLHPFRVALVAQAQVGGERVGADVGTLRLAPGGPDGRVGDEVDLHVRVRRDHRADVAALHHRI